MHLDQSQTPLLSMLQHCANRPNAPFYTPGHKRGQGAAQPLVELLGPTALQADLPELPELDNLFAPEGVIQQAQALAADLFGADHTWFLANGSTCGIEAAILATCGPGDKIILPRTVHQSVISGLVLSGALPIFVQPEYDPVWALTYGVTPQAIAAALDQHPEAKAVLAVSPTYQGVCSDIAAIAQLTHAVNIPLLVDEAHGPHFALHPALPTPALEAGADLVVQSTHKVLGALTQAAMMHLQGSSIDPDRILQSLQFLESSSPSYLLLASLDAARYQMATEGEALMAKTLQLSQTARSQIQALTSTRLLSTPDLARFSKNQLPAAKHPVHSWQSSPTDFKALDPTRLTLDVTPLGLTGFEADEILHQQFGVTAELPTLHHLTFIISLGNTEQDIAQLIQGCQNLELAAKSRNRMLVVPSQDVCSSAPEGVSGTPKALGETVKFAFPATTSSSACSPRQAFFSPTEILPIHRALNRVSAELICPYPPGIPVLFPGEEITQAALTCLESIRTAGGIITGCTDPTLQCLKVVKA